MSGSHILLLAIVLVIVFFGPRNIPQLGRSLGDAIRGFKKGIAGESDDEIDVTASAKEKLDPSKAEEQSQAKQKHKDKA